MDEDNVTPLFGSVDGGNQPDYKPARLFEFMLKDADKTVVQAYGYPAFNGMIYAVLDEANDVDSINFCALASEVLYAQAADVSED
jgi:hypothetical protein